MEQLLSDKCIAEIEAAKLFCASEMYMFEKTKASTATPQEAVEFFEKIQKELKNKIDLALEKELLCHLHTT